MILYLKENTNKKIYVDESRIHLLKERFDENAEDEGGIYNINNIRKGREKGSPTYMDSNYTYTNDNGNDGIYADFTPYGKKKGYLNPLNPNWIQVRGNMPYNPEKSKRYPQISDQDMPNYMPSSDDEFIRYNGTLYTPTKHRIMQGKGDVIKNNLKPDKVYVGRDENGKEQYVMCYNLTMLGEGGTNARKLATMIAHTYKEKDCGFGELYKTFMLRNRGNLINGEWKDKITTLIKNTSDLIKFNPTYIIYPQSSSNFNDYIAEYIKTIFPNATLMPKNILQKLDIWEFDYDDLIYQTIEYAERGTDSQTKYKDVYSKYDVLKNDYIKEALLRRLVTILSNKLLRKLHSIMYYNMSDDMSSSFVKRFNSFYKKNYGRGLNQKEVRSANVLDRIWEFINDEIEIMEKSLVTSKLFNSVKDLNNYKEKIAILSFQSLFKNQNAGKFNSSFQGRNAKDRTETFKNIEAFELSFVRGDIEVNQEGTKALADKSDTIKNYDNPSRMALKGQFKFNNDYDLSTIKPSDRFIIIDDNYASGASIRNAARVIAELGVPLTNIIGLTPGDMGGASSGGKRGAEVPENSAEEWLAYNHAVNGAYNDLPDGVKNILLTKHKQLSSNQSHDMQNRTRAQQQGNLGQKFVEYNQERPYYGGGRRKYSQEERENVYHFVLKQIKELRDLIKKYTNEIKKTDDLQQKEILKQEKNNLIKRLRVATTREHNLRKNWGMEQLLTKPENRNKKYFTKDDIQNKIDEVKGKLNILEREYNDIKTIWHEINKNYMKKYGRDYHYDKFLSEKDKKFLSKKRDLGIKISKYRNYVKQLQKKMQP